MLARNCVNAALTSCELMNEMRQLCDNVPSFKFIWINPVKQQANQQ